jgi:flagellar motility protein MotE (MotC chaperone)
VLDRLTPSTAALVLLALPPRRAARVLGASDPGRAVRMIENARVRRNRLPRVL